LYFFISNYSAFEDLSLAETVWAFIAGIRFDIASISSYNALFILLSLLPAAIVSKRIYQIILKGLFFIINIPLILADLADAHYFKFTQKRSTFDITSTLKGDDFSQMIFQYIVDYWFVFLLSILIFIVSLKLYPKQKNIAEKGSKSLKKFILSISSFLFIAVLTSVAIRGVDHRPIAITSAAKFANANSVSLVLNTPFTLLKTINKKPLELLKYYDDYTAQQYFSPIKQYQSKQLNKKNVVIIILESFGKEYSAYYNNGIGYMPFLDSLSQHSLHFRYSFANGQRSMEALPSIFNSMPSLTDRAYIVSQFASNKTEGLASVLKQLGYHTSFMHGGANGTMDFDKFCYMSGFDKYYGKSQYPNSKDDDGHWGIYDEPYLQYCVRKMNRFQEPFMNAIFTLSSHHPYPIPEKYKNKFPKGTNEIHESIAYADFALSQFFESAKNEVWYNNTIFVITADHTSISNSSYYQKSIGNHAVPIVFYSPGD
jgi:phosphoglycerol transferase MdoB-like AlkP superfamily enzyme